MEVSVYYRLYNTYGGHKSITLAGYYLEYDIPDFGSAIKEIEITLYFYHDGPARKTLEDMQAKFHENLSSLPKCTFYRKKGRVTLDFEAKFTTGYEIEKNYKPPIEINPEWVKATLSEIINHLYLIKPKIKKSDDFDFNSFEIYLNQKFENVPLNVLELEKIQQAITERRKQKFETLGEQEMTAYEEKKPPNDKIILDIRYYGSKTENIFGNPHPSSISDLFDFPKELHFWSDRIARKLREKNLKIGSFDHLYVNYTTASEPNTIHLSSRKTGEPWYRYVDYGVDLKTVKNYNPEELEKFVINSTFNILKLLCRNDPEKQKIIEETQQEINKKGIEIEIEHKRKETKSYTVIISYKIAPDLGDSLGYINFIDKKSGKSFKGPFIKLQSYSDIYPLVDRISVKKGTIILNPRNSFSAGFYTAKYEVPIEIDIESKLAA